MARYELLISGRDESDLASGHRRIKEGDVIAVRPSPWNWGRKEIDQYLVVIVECSATRQEMENLTVRQFDGTDVDTLEQQGAAMEAGRKAIAKRRYAVPLELLKTGWMPDLDLEKVRDERCIYQPFKSAAQLVAKFDGKNGNRLLDMAQVDTASAYSLAESEMVVDLDAKVAFCMDRARGTFKYQTVKVYG